MKEETHFFDLILREWLLVVSALMLLITSFYIGHLPHYSSAELEVLFILFSLFIVVNGLRRSGLITKISTSLETGHFIPSKLIILTFFLSMLITNDVALIIMVPITLSLRIDRKDILVILEALAANAGSALTPVGNPQNLYIYWFYHLSPGQFIQTIAPLSALFLVLLLLFTLCLKTEESPQIKALQRVDKKAHIYILLLMIVLLTVLHLLPLLSPVVVIGYVLVFDRKALSVDYALLLSFLCFFGVADHLKIILASEINHAGHTFFFSALASQILSNVPATLLFAKFTSHWQALLWGVNVGGFGSIFGSLANLIAYKLYISHSQSKKTTDFTIKFLLFGYAAFFISISFYILFHNAGGDTYITI